MLSRCCKRREQGCAWGCCSMLWCAPSLASARRPQHRRPGSDRHPALAGQLGRDWSDIDAEFDAALDVVLRGVDAQARAARVPGVGSS